MNQQKPVRTIAVVLGDNDYGNTFKPLLESLHRGIVWNDGLSREAIETAIKAGVEFHYLAFQFGRHSGKVKYGTIESTMSHLNDIRILFDEEAEADISQKDHDGGAWYLELATGQVYSY